ncbi:MAG: VOC family protein [Gemmatimonadaceae bacterium]
MSDSLVKGAQLDHVELFVPDREQAAAWYARVLGLQPVAAMARWATPRGPLMLSADGGKSMVALFTGEPCEHRRDRSHHRVAFRVPGAEFLAFVAVAPEGPIYDAFGIPMVSLTPIDHGGAFSVYFADPWGHLCEVTTYDWRHILAHGDRRWAGDSTRLHNADAMPPIADQPLPNRR